MDFLKTIQGSPSANEIENYKSQAPGGRVKVFTPDGAKRVFVIRALSGLEMETISKQIPANAENRELEMQIHSCARATIWTNTTQDGQVDDLYFKRAPAGLATSMFTLVSRMSDFMDPETLEMLSADL